ncbi:MAG: tetratricopeptide repeat protein [Candidatus Omnitrophica bacterium]|nr:tetratricopeptide repeat protein [Candidatus Omnitrophota bacterium]
MFTKNYFKRTRDVFCGVLFLSLCFSVVFFSDVQADIRERQAVEINKSLKTLIEENQRLVDDNDGLKFELRKMKGNMDNRSSFESLKQEKEDIAGRYKRIEKVNQRYSRKIRALEDQIEKLKQEDDVKSSQIGNEFDDQDYLRNLQKDYNMQLVSSGDKDVETSEVTQREISTIELLTSIDAFIEDDERVRSDAAKAHYNMGNIYFQKGKYEIAYREYYQAVNLMPDDPDSHYNLAFVSGEYLKDFKTALKHYKMYMYLKPQAKDSNLVRQKIMEAELEIRSMTDSPLEDGDYLR